MITQDRHRHTLLPRILTSMNPVRPMPSVHRRAALLALVGFAAAVAVPIAYELRADAETIGQVRLWAGSAAQLALAVAVVSLALAEGIPGSMPAARTSVAVLGCAAALMVIIALDTAWRSPGDVPAQLARRYFAYCYAHVGGLGALLMLPMTAAMRRGLFARPALAGTLAGAGAGLMADAAWRLFCHVSAPVHVLPAHAGAAVALAALGGCGGLVLRLARGRG